MQFTSEQRLDDGILEREFILGEIPGILWTPASAPAPAPLILLSPPPLGLRKTSATDGFATATIELPGSGDRPRLPAAEQALADLRRAMEAGEPVSDEIVDALILPLVDKAVPEWTGRPGCPPFAARDRRPGRVLGRSDLHRHPAGGGRAAHLCRQPTRQRERAMKGFRSVGGAQRLLAAFSGTSPHFRPRRHLLTAGRHRTEMIIRFAIWDQITHAAALPGLTQTRNRAQHALTQPQATTPPPT